MSKANIVDLLIANIKTDQKLLTEAENKLETVKEEKRVIVHRLKDYHKDVSVLLKYADDAKKKELEDLGFDFSQSEQGLNAVGSKVYDLITKAKDNQLTNGELYDLYVKSIPDTETVVSYTEFNIKCRSLFNTQRLLRKKGKNPKSTRDDIISLNGRVLKSETPKTEKKS